GEAGIGKSRLVHELIDSLGDEVGSVQRWQCSPHYQSTSLYPVTTYLGRHLGIRTLEDLTAPVDAAGLDPAEAVPLLDDLPLFGEEMLKAGRAPEASVVPPTLEGLLTERLDRLPDLADVIDHAAVLGREFDRPLLAALEPLNGADLDLALVQLAEQDVLRPVA